jgi:hypothetical protein
MYLIKKGSAKKIIFIMKRSLLQSTIAKKAICKNKEKIKEVETTLAINGGHQRKLRKFLAGYQSAARINT